MADESRLLWKESPKGFRLVVEAVMELERLTAETGGLVLRFGHLYGPGTAFAPDGAFIGQIATGRAPIVGKGNAMYSFLHTHDAAMAIAAALYKPVTGAVNVVDDQPVPVRDWLPQVAEMIGARPPRHVPVALARMAVGAWAVASMNRIVGADNSRVRARPSPELDLAP